MSGCCVVGCCIKISDINKSIPYYHLLTKKKINAGWFVREILNENIIEFCNIMKMCCVWSVISLWDSHFFPIVPLTVTVLYYTFTLRDF